MALVVLIGCSKTKLDHAAPACQLYRGERFVLAHEKAERLGADYVFVLSTRHGLIPIDKVIEPYDESLEDKTPEERGLWARKVIRQLADAPYPAGDWEVIMLAEDLYADPLRLYMTSAKYPLTGLDEDAQKLFLA
jgi:hypothetical protein